MLIICDIVPNFLLLGCHGYSGVPGVGAGSASSWTPAESHQQCYHGAETADHG